MPYQVEVTVEHELDPSISESFLTAVAREALRVDGAPEGVVSLVITDDATVQELNREYRDLDEPTDVLSFGLGGLAKPLEEEPDGFDFVVPGDQPLEIGEVIIAYPYAARQAAATGRAVRDEVALLVTHGVLHLLGHDHLEPEESAAMRAREVETLAAFGIARD